VSEVLNMLVGMAPKLDLFVTYKIILHDGEERLGFK